MACVRTLLELGADASHTNVKGGPQPMHRAAASGLHVLSFSYCEQALQSWELLKHSHIPDSLQHCI